MSEATQLQASQLVHEIDRLKWHINQFASHESQTLFASQLLVMAAGGTNEYTPPSWTITAATQLPLAQKASVRQVDIYRRYDWSTGAGVPVYSATCRNVGPYEGGLEAVKGRVTDRNRDWWLPGTETNLSRWGAQRILRRLSKLDGHDVDIYRY